jgi:molybdopterin-guanine dinucleotide biosynthesis protein A
MKPHPDLMGIVLAGGASRRMGTDKALLDLRGVPMIRRVLDALAVCCVDLLVVAKEPSAYASLGVRVVLDEAEAQAPLVGVCAGLRATTVPWAFVAACDLPFVSPAAVSLLAQAARGWDAAVPRVGGRWHSLHAVYATGAAGALEVQLAAGIRSMVAALDALRVKAIDAAALRAADPSLRTLRHVNTRSAYRRVVAELGS